MTFATGIEYREDRYGIQAGEPASYYGAGAASFPGYNPDVNTGSYKRDNYAGYVNFIFVPTNPWLVDVALRYENYSDFGNESVGKLPHVMTSLSNSHCGQQRARGFVPPHWVRVTTPRSA